MSDNTITLILTGMTHGGRAIGRYEGRAIFVPYGLPGERVRVRIVQDKGRFAVAEIIEVLERVDYRTASPCPYFGHCGGCQFQDIDYAKQLEFKQQIVHDQITRLGGLADVLVHPTIPSPDVYHYRTHATFHTTTQGKPGFIRTDHRTILPVEDCLLLAPSLHHAYEQTKKATFPSGARIRFQAGTDGKTIHFPMGAIADDVAEPLPDKKPHHTHTPALPQPAAGRGSVEYTLLGRRFRCSAGSFFQVNLPQAARLVELVLERLQLSGRERLLDLYAGVGLFTAFLAHQAAHVDAVELFAPAVEDARHNLRDYTNVAFHIGRIEALLPDLDGNVDAAVVDPPRAGMDAPALEALINCQPKRLVYVSCDPATLARDAKRFVASGYQLHEVQPVDMFPQTYHIECVAYFTFGM